MDVNGHGFRTGRLEGVRILQGRKELAPNWIGLIGHSEGASVASLAASLSDAVAYVVLLGSPGMTGEEITLGQMRTLAGRTGLNAQVIRHNQEVQRQVFEVLRQEQQDDSAEVRIRSVLSTLADYQPSKNEHES